MIEIKQQLISQTKYPLKCPYTMIPEYITIHNTASDASAQEEIRYMVNRTDKSTSYHIAVDEKEAIQSIPFNRNGWHAGDGTNGVGNRKSIGIEICRSTSIEAELQALVFRNAVEVTYQLMKKYNISIDKVVQHNHWTGKNCPHKIREEKTWELFKLLLLWKQGGIMQDQLISTSYKGCIVKAIYCGKEDGYDYKVVTAGEPFGPNALKLPSQIESKLEGTEGVQVIARINGSIFYSYKEDGVTKYYAEGLEKCEGVEHQMWDTSYDTCLAIADGQLLLQKYIRENSTKYQNAMTGAFGIMLNGERCDAGVDIASTSKRNFIYTNISGRTIYGYNRTTGQYILVSVPGVTGKSGLYGKDLFGLCSQLGMTDAICLDGGGSVYMGFNGKVVVSTSRKVKNDLIVLKIKQVNKPIAPPTEGDNCLGIVMCTDKGTLAIRKGIMSKDIIKVVPKNSFIEIVEFIDGTQKDTYQWVRSRFIEEGITFEGYSQLDTAWTPLKEER